VNHAGRKRRFASSFVLTLEEKKVICFVLLALILGLVTKEYRDKHPPPTPPAVKAAANGKRNPLSGKSPRNKETRTENASR
jgi:hypothetical protein